MAGPARPEEGDSDNSGGTRDPNVRPGPGLPSPAEDAVLQRYTECLAKLRETREIYERMKGDSTKSAKELERADTAYQSARRGLDLIETEALNAADSDLAGHLDPLVKERGKLERGERTEAGRRVPCDAVKRAPKNLRGMDYAEIRKAMGRPPDGWDLAQKPTKGAARPTSHRRLWWEFDDGSRLVVDLPRDLDRVHKTADLPHAELHGPKGQRLDQQGIEVPEESTPAHMTITDHDAQLRKFFIDPEGKGH